MSTKYALQEIGDEPPNNGQTDRKKDRWGMPSLRAGSRRGRASIIVLLTAVTAALPAIPSARAGAAVPVPASADATVAAATPGANFGTAPTLEVDKSEVLEAFVAFDVPDQGAAVTRARLRLFVVNASANAPKVYRSDTAGPRPDITWGTRPARHELLDDLGAVQRRSVGRVRRHGGGARSGTGQLRPGGRLERRHRLQRPGMRRQPARTGRRDGGRRRRHRRPRHRRHRHRRRSVGGHRHPGGDVERLQRRRGPGHRRPAPAAPDDGRRRRRERLRGRHL